MQWIRFTLYGAIAALLIGCGSTSGGGSASSGSGGAEMPAASDGDLDAPAVYNTIRDCRVILYQPQTRSAIILVNNAHSRRATEEGRLWLAMNRPDQGYKILSDRQMDALLESFEARNASLVAEPFRSSDERLLGAGPTDIPDFKGIIVVENDGERVKYAGWRPRGDAAKAQRYQIYVDLKLLVGTWQQATSRVEMPMEAGLGAGRGDLFDVPRPTRRPDGR